jgi:acetoacetate decarboxylase
MTRGYSLPLSPGGSASIIPSPPWHYVGDFLVIEYWADADAVAAVLPEGLTPFADDPGRCAALFVDWQSCSDSGEELLDPVRGQYKEFFIVANAMLGTEHVTTCPYIWVDRDFALIRGWIQGFPKKLGEVHMTRSFGLDCKAEGRAFAGTLTAHGRLLAEGSVTPERVSESGPTHNDPPLINHRHFPRLAAGRWQDAAVDELVRARSSDRSISAIHEGSATLRLHDAPGEEHAALAPLRVGKGFRFQFAYTVDDLETVHERA